MREILTRAVARPNIGVALADAARETGGVDDLVLPRRDDVARVVEFE